MKLIINIIIIILFPFLVVSQSNVKTTTDKNTWQEFTYDMGSVFGGIGYAYSRPFHWDSDNWSTFGGVATGTLLAYTIDSNAKTFFENQKEDIPELVRDYGWYYGSPQNNYMLTGAVYLTGLITKNEKLRRAGVLLISSASTAGLLQQASKYAFGRARPRSGDDKNTFHPFSSDKDYHSFPSGHAILAFTNAYAIAKQFKNPWVKAGLYTVGLVPGVSRLWEGAHWLSDMTLSIAISIFTVEAIDRYLDSRYSEKYNRQHKNVSWNLKLSPGQLGVVACF
ncbi:phosphatase PAP2 family protein [Galbibacter sp. EGI 63066]|uniref:phosphatase PAP2 family protein n=1 Tax=Galbibacter sp. EGI 63066 TaxID=2993559 RepID=UPI002248D92D|nr:phosphatase PAP2 family protein [Galbibacter sp. EGI 63066]MCX2680928.1 phosphatase PAP2 family protein [Galbibacter sp. EGI 63066]